MKVKLLIMYNIANLTEYINVGKFLVNIEVNNLFDIVIFESRKFLDKEFLKIEKFLKIYFIEDLGFDWGLSGILDGFENKRILIVLNEYNSFYLMPLLNLINFRSRSFKKLHILNTNVGICSLIYKNIPEVNDVVNVSEFFDVYEPIDFQDLISILSKDKSVYIRVANKDYAVDIFNGQTRNFTDESIVDLTSFNLSGQNGTILVGGSVLSNVLQAVNILQTQGYFFDVFVIRNYNFKFNESLKESLCATERLVFIGDIKGNGIVNLVKSRVWEIGIYDLIIDFIFPKYEKIDTTLLDYIYERAEFDYKSLANRIIDLLRQ